MTHRLPRTEAAAEGPVVDKATGQLLREIPDSPRRAGGGEPAPDRLRFLGFQLEDQLNPAVNVSGAWSLTAPSVFRPTSGTPRASTGY